jgi:HAD superfamily hydrolase (TIGR01509 family)
METLMQLPTSAKYLLFDMDGTLVNTEPVGPATFVNQLQKYGIAPTQDERDLFSKIWRRDGTDIKQDDWLPAMAQKYRLDRSSEDYLKEFYALYVEAVVAAPALLGVDDFLKAIQESKQYKTALVTASKQTQVVAILAHHGWDETFDTIITSEDITKFKPDPESFLVGMQKLGASPELSVVFEDSKNGAKSGKDAGCYVIGIRAGNSQPQDLSSADTIVESFKDIDLYSG